MNIDKIKEHLDWEQYYNPNFNWDNWGFYHRNRLSEDFIREFANSMHWGCISQTQKLSEDFIREFQDKVWWVLISEYQNLSEPFIEEFADRVHWIKIFEEQKLSDDFKHKWRYKLYEY